MTHTDMNGRTLNIGDRVYYEPDGPGTVGVIDGWDDAQNAASVVYTLVSGDTDEYWVKHAELVLVEKAAAAPAPDLVNQNPAPVPPKPQTAIQPMPPAQQVADRTSIWPGAVVTLRRNTTKHKFNPDRLWVVLAFTKNKQQTFVNISLLNGKTAKDPKTYTADYISVPIINLDRVIFGSLLLKVRA